MAKLEAGRKGSSYIIKSLLPDVCKVPPNAVPTPFDIQIKLTDATLYSENVNFKSEPAAMIVLRCEPVTGNEAGTLGGILSGVNKGACRPINFVPTVRVNNKNVLYHNDNFCFMNCAGPDGPFNTIGKLYCLDEMATGPAANPEDPMAGDPAIALTPEEASAMGGKPSLISKIANTPGMGVKLAKMAYGVSQNGFSPEAVLGGLGSIAGVAGFDGLAKTANLGLQAKKLADTDWNNPAAALAALSGAVSLGGAMSGMSSLGKTAKSLKTLSQAVGISQAFKANKSGGMMMGVNAVSGLRTAAQANPQQAAQIKIFASQSGQYQQKANKAKQLQRAQSIALHPTLSKDFNALININAMKS